MLSIAEILKVVVGKLAFNEPIRTVVDNSNGTFNITLDSTQSLVSGTFVIINAEQYKIKSLVSPTELFFDSGTLPSIDDIVEISAPKFHHGTIKAVSSELNKLSSRDYLPMIYLYEILQENRNRDNENPISREPELSIFFLEEANFKNWLTEDHYTEVIKPMDNLAERFIDLIQNDSFFGSIEEQDYTITPHAKFGWSDRNGHLRNMFDINLSGVELKIKIPIQRSCSETDEEPNFKKQEATVFDNVNPNSPIKLKLDSEYTCLGLTPILNALFDQTESTDTMNQITIDSDNAETYLTHVASVGSGAIEVDINGAGFIPVPSPMTLSIGNTFVAKRANSIVGGDVKFTG